METSLFLLILSTSLPKKRIIRPVGVTTIKNTIPITTGDTIEPKRIPNLNHSLFNGDKNLEFKTPKTKKTKDKIIAYNLISASYFKGHKATIKNTTKNTNPKFLFDKIFILEFNVIIN